MTAISTGGAVEPLVTIGVGRKLRLLSCYHPSAILPIQSSEQCRRITLVKLVCPDGEFPDIGRRSRDPQHLYEYFAAARDAVPKLTPRTSWSRFTTARSNSRL